MLGEEREGRESRHSPSPQECRWVPGGRGFPGNIFLKGEKESMRKQQQVQRLGKPGVVYDLS